MPSFDSSNDLRLNLLFKNLLNRRFTKVAAADRQELAGITYTAPEQIFAEPIPTTDPGSHPTPPRDFQDNDPNNSSLGKILVSDLCGDYSYIKKYENIHMSVISDTNNLTWRATNVSMQPLLKQAIIGSNWFRISVEVDSNIAISNNSAPLIHNGLLIFTGNSDLPNSNSTVKISQILIYEGLTLPESLNAMDIRLLDINRRVAAIKTRLDFLDRINPILDRLHAIDGHDETTTPTVGTVVGGSSTPVLSSPLNSTSRDWVIDNINGFTMTVGNVTTDTVTVNMVLKVDKRWGGYHQIDAGGYSGYLRNNQVQIYGYTAVGGVTATVQDYQNKRITVHYNDGGDLGYLRHERPF